MKNLLWIIFSFSASTLFAQNNYWQQEVNYTIKVSLDDKQHSLKGQLALDYINNSPDTLNFIWFHLWPNGYKNENTAFAKQLLNDADGRKRLKNPKNRGYIDSLSFFVNGKKALIEPHPEHIDIVKLLLAAPLKPKEKINITTPFFVQLPAYNSRSGYSEQLYVAAQWYPKPAVYDRKGWHPMPYLDQGEYYSEFGSFDVTISLPSTYIVGATGVLQNPDELKQYKSVGKANVDSKSKTTLTTYKTTLSGDKNLQFKGEKIHDFAWFASKDFIIKYDTLALPSGKIIDAFAYHHPKGNKHWAKSIDFLKTAVRSYSSYLGEYEYPVVAAVEGPSNDMSGGMEYPMITLITSPTADAEYLDAVITHEVGHNWFYGMIASNERAHAWMDEGLNTYYQFRYEAEKYRSNSVFGNALPAELKGRPVDDFLSIIYDVLNKIPMDKPIDTHSAAFTNKEEYGMVQYLKASIWMYIIEANFGKEKLDNAMKAYFNEWKFKHPYPEDLQKVLERELEVPLDTYFDLLKKQGSL
ncbi:MAG: M1 family metallopeptidase [Chitinophagaceae bacterium]